MDTFAAMWAGYMKDVIPPHATEMQRIETKRAFYAGAHAVLGVSVIAANTMGEEEGTAALQSLADEVGDFIESGGLA